MACICRIIRSIPIKHGSILIRNLTSNPGTAIQKSSLIPQIITNNPWIWQQNNKIELPLIKNTEFELPNGMKYVPLIEDTEAPSIELPAINNGHERKEAVRMIVIRRKKMKKHKLKKLRKKMKFEWAKRRQRRELKKEKEFQAVLVKQCKEGEGFSAEKYVEERIRKLHDVLARKEVTKNEFEKPV